MHEHASGHEILVGRYSIAGLASILEALHPHFHEDEKARVLLG